MTGEELTGMIKNPQRLYEITVNELIELTRKHPWCASFRLLLLKRMHVDQHPGFNQQLALNAIRIGDRSVLYDFLHTPDKHTPAPEPGSSSNQIATEPGPEESSEKVATETKTELPEQLQKHDGTVDEPETADEPDSADESASAEELVATGQVISDDGNAGDMVEPKHEEDLIIRFIREEPRIVPRDGDFAESVRIAARSNEPALDLVTETLANIYLQQGDKNKAIKIFEQLSLTIPEKRSYFAARIAEVRNEANKL
jgi:hypothetical protein